MTTIRMSAAAALVVLAALADQPVQALPAVQAEFKLSYYPPNPCIDLGNPTLDGQASLYLDGLAQGAGSAGPLACSDDGSGSTFAVRFEAPTAGELTFDFEYKKVAPSGDLRIKQIREVPGPATPGAQPTWLLNETNR